MRLVAALVLILASLPAAGADRVRLVVNGAWNPPPAGFGETRSFTEFVETGTLDTSYRAKGAVGADAGVQLTLFRQLGVYAARSSANREETGTFQAAYPHPLYLNRPRRLSGDLSGYEFAESATHLDLAFGRRRGQFDYALFAGVSFFSVEADTVEAVRYSHSYPYDEVSLSQVARTRLKDTPTGFNAGGRLDYRFGKRGVVGVGVQLRYSSATARFKSASDKSLDIGVGGLRAGLGARLYF